MLTPLLHSLLIASCATALGFLLMLPLAYLGAFRPYPGRMLVEIVLLLPLVLPPTIVGLYLLQLFGRYGALGFLGTQLIFTLAGATLATTLIIIPLIYQGLKAGFLHVSQDLIDAARVTGTNRRQLIWYVILPSSWPMVLATLLLSFGRALGEFGASLMVAGYIPGKTDSLANAIYFAVQNGDTKSAILLSLINIAIGVGILLVIHLLSKKGS